MVSSCAPAIQLMREDLLLPTESEVVIPGTFS